MTADVVRLATAAELADLYRALATGAPGFVTDVPSVTFTGAEASSGLRNRLDRFGVTVHELPEEEIGGGPAAWVLGGSAHGTRVPATEPHQVATVVERSRLRDWAREIGDQPRFTTMHKPGSDSRGVVQFRLGDTDVVAKIGDADAITAEVRFARSVNELLTGHGYRELFPRVHGLVIEGEQAVSLMEAGTPMPISALFADDARTALADEAIDLLRPHLELVGAWYRLTARDRRPTVADYLYRERYHALRDFPEFKATYQSFFGELPLSTLLDAAVELPGGLMVPSFTESVAWLDEVVPHLLPDNGSAVHGDIYAANMLLRADGSPALIDPRTVWEGRDRPDVGYGDPVFDLSTLLHGVLPMAAVLRAVETDTSAMLFDDEVRPHGDKLNLSSLRLPVGFTPSVRALETLMLQVLPDSDQHARTRLYIGAATSLLGWLKYERSLRTPQAWLATFAFVTWYLWQARITYGEQQ